MKVMESSISESDILKIKDAVKNHKPVEFSCSTLTAEQKTRFTEILQVFLDACNQQHLYTCLSYCLLELLDNASKANAKRVYFKENNLNIEDEVDYKKGITAFKQNLSEKNQHYIEELKNGFLKIDLQLSIDNVICLKVINNIKITEIEYKRINEKIEKTSAYNNMEDAIFDVDQTEGSGLGIITIIIMLKKLGLKTSNLRFSRGADSTVATLEIPVDSFIEI